MQKKCPECGDKIVGRVDKKFCSDACRNAFNNNINKDHKNLIRNTNRTEKRKENVMLRLQRWKK